MSHAGPFASWPASSANRRPGLPGWWGRPGDLLQGEQHGLVTRGVPVGHDDGGDSVGGVQCEPVNRWQRRECCGPPGGYWLGSPWPGCGWFRQRMRKRYRRRHRRRRLRMPLVLGFRGVRIRIGARASRSYRHITGAQRSRILGRVRRCLRALHMVRIMRLGRVIGLSDGSIIVVWGWFPVQRARCEWARRGRIVVRVGVIRVLRQAVGL